MKELKLKVEEKIHNNNICKYHLLPALSTSRIYKKDNQISFFTFLKFFFTFCFQHFLTLNKYFLVRRISKQIDDIMNRTFPNWYGKISEIQGALMLLDSALIGNLDLIPSGSIPDRLKRIPPINGFCFPLGDFKFTRKFLTPTDLLLSAFSGPGTRCVQYGI